MPVKAKTPTTLSTMESAIKSDDDWKPPIYALPAQQSDWKPPDYANVVPADEGKPWYESTKDFLAKSMDVTGGTPNVVGPGFMKIPGMERAADYIRRKGRESGNYYAGFGSSLLGDVLSGASTGFDPRTAGKGKVQPVQELSKVAEDIPLASEVAQPAEKTLQVPKQLGPAKSIQLPATTDQQLGMSTQAYTGTGKGYELLHPNRIEPASEVIQPTLDQLHAQPKVPISVEDINKIPPGQATAAPMTNGKDIKPFRAEFSSPHVVMDNFPTTKPIIQSIMNAQDSGTKWLATEMRAFTEPSQGLSKADRQSLMMILNGEEVPNASPEIYQRAERARALLDNVYDLAQDKSSADIGFIDRYITHIKAQPDDIQSAMKAIWERNFGKESGLAKVFSSGEEGAKTGEVGDIYEKGLGKPESPFIKTRTGVLQDIETDYNRIIPVYLESMKKTIFDRPATDAATDALKSIPVGKLKEYLQAYIKNYTRYDADPQLAGAWNALANQIATINARSVISFNPVVHMYHAGQLPANIWPELGTKYSSIGLGKFISSPIQAYQELAKNGLFSNMIRPMQFQTAAQKLDSIGYYMNMVESLVKGTGYYGFKQKFLDAGASELDATMRAIAETKNATATVDPARMMKFFTPESNVAGGQMMMLGKQYRQIPAKLIESFARAAADFKANPAKAARYVAGTSVAGAGAAAGIHTLHASPLSLVSELSSVSPVGGQFTNVMKSIYTNLSKGDVGSALGDVLAWITPGGGVAKKIIQ